MPARVARDMAAGPVSVPIGEMGASQSARAVDVEQALAGLPAARTE